MKILAVCSGQPERLTGKTYKTGINKVPVKGPVPVDAQGLLGDAICNKKHHGGPDQAVYLEGALTLAWWSEQLGQMLTAGSFGENLVIDGLDNRQVAVGDRFLAGGLVLEATAPRSPCATFGAKMGDPAFVKRYFEAARPGIYCRVIAPDLVEAGMDVAFFERPGDRIMIADLLSRPSRWPAGLRDRALAAPISARLRAALVSR